ncbi:HAD-IIIA family hydrolase [Xinfangfangia sp. CPCC 101601]|uniref:D,D-heptose 1,7-bisphosphate phosphatase n=1 Tax=Pseudogemmobacter lacusdianii TaxID=3069608 RepID=A0ABU0W2F8_9RHOB|nr:HAD-IIIA family hydrolase [Xinfangfangia sp. CPCC 101601]MDQ2067260.1 HAD-IIIA family hydrolase [Xinfangfangia sp. CPCC 101601]
MTHPLYVRQAVVLVGGLGTRLGPLTAETPKPLLPVAGRPFLDWLISWLAQAGVEEIILSTGYLAETFAPFLAQGRKSGRWHTPEGFAVTLRESREETPLGTAGALGLLRGQLDPQLFLVNGDSFFACDPVAIATAATALPRGHALLTTRLVPDTGRFGRVESDASGRITRFAEKGISGPGMIHAGIAVLSHAVLDRIPPGPSSLENDIYPALAAEGLLHAKPQQGYFIDIGLPQTYAQAQTDLPKALRRPAVFFDRDDVLNRDDDGYAHRSDALQLMPGAARAVALARQRGFRTVVVTNQSGIARGLYDEPTMRRFHQALNAQVRAEAGGWIDAFYHCPFHPDAPLPAYRAANHPDRKPNPGMILRAAADLFIDLPGSLLVGDKDSDIAAANATGITGLLHQSGDLAERLAEALDRLSPSASGGAE